MAITYKMLGQVRPANTTATSIYTLPADTEAVIYTLRVCNHSAATVKVSAFVDNVGTGYDDDTDIEDELPIPAHTARNLLADGPVTMANEGGNLAVKTETANDVTFSAFGTERT